MTFRGILLLIIFAVIIAWFAQDEIFDWLTSNHEDDDKNEDDDKDDK